MAKATAEKPTFSADFLDKIKALLLKDKERIEKELKNQGEDGAFPDYGDSEEDNAREIADFEATSSVENNLQRTLRDIVSSLKRIEKGDYGICKYCKKPIEEKRLMVRATSSACVACKKTIVQEA